MPLPAATFTKAKWLAFFAELSAKITHHNFLVSREGCEMLQRLLLTQISVAALLQEGDFLRALLEAFVGGVRSDRPLTTASAALDEELSMAQLHTISLCVDLMAALYADGDAYYTLLVLARAGELIQGLLEVLRRGHAHARGLVANVLSSLLALPIGRDPSLQLLAEASDTSASSSSPSVALKRHVHELAELVRSHGVLLQDTADTLASVAASTEGAPRLAALRLLDMTYKRLRKHHLRRLKGQRRGMESATAKEAAAAPVATDPPVTREEDTVSGADFNVTITGAAPTPTAAAAATTAAASVSPAGAGVCAFAAAEEGGNHEEEEAAVEKTEGDPIESTEVDIEAVLQRRDRGAVAKGVAEDEQDISDLVDREAAEVLYSVPAESIRSAFRAVAECKSHDDGFSAMSDLWALTVADGRSLAAQLDGEAFKGFRRFLTVAPATRQDQVLFTELLFWLGRVMSSQVLRPDTVCALLDIVGASFLPMLVADLNHRDEAQAQAPGRPSSSSLSAAGDGGGASPSFSATRTHERASLMERPSLSPALLLFLLSAERACRAQQLAQWVQTSGLLTVLERTLRDVESVKSSLIDTPTTVEGALSDEVYLACAMRMAKTNHVLLATLSCKLLASLLWGHTNTLKQLLSAEVAALLREVTPLLLRVATQNPTVATSAKDGASISPLYGCPRGGFRYTPLGECAAVAFDACLFFNRSARLRCLDLSQILPLLPALFRCTSQSVHAPLRGVVYRAVAYICSTPTPFSMILTEMPSLVAAAVGSVLAYRPDAPQQWESAAAAAAWLCAVVRLSEPRDAAEEEKGDGAARTLPLEQPAGMAHAQSALSLRLLDLAASAPLNAATTALLELCVTLSEQEERGDGLSVLAPYGHSSLGHWRELMQTATSANEKLTRLARHSIWVFNPDKPSSNGGVALTACTTADALARALGALENIAVQYAFTATVLRCLCSLLAAFPAYRVDFTHESVYRLMGAALSAPSPARVFSLLSVRFGVPVDHHATLTRVYDELIQWGCELTPVWFQGPSPSPPSTTAECPPIPPSVFESAARIMSDGTIPQRTRCHIPLFISSVLILAVPPPSPCVADAREGAPGTDSSPSSSSSSSSTPSPSSSLWSSMDGQAGELFTASLSLRRLTCVSGMQCRLTSSFRSANEEAVRCGWFADRVQDLATLVKLLVFNGGVLDEQDTESFLATLSLASSVVCFPHCGELSHELRQTLCAALAEGVRYEHTRVATLKALKAMADSAEGRRCLLHEIAASGEPLARSCFGRVLALTFGIPTVFRGVAHAQPPSARVSASAPIREAVEEVVVDTGAALLTAACGSHDRRSFVAALLKYKSIEVLERLLCSHEQKRQQAPPSGGRALSWLRLVAVLSFDSEGQKAIAQRPTLLTALLEWAGRASPHGSLALLVVRNLCFHNSLKTVMCQDMRVLLTLKAAFMGLPAVNTLVLAPERMCPVTGSGGGGGAGGPRGEEEQARWTRRQRSGHAANTVWPVLRREVAESGNASLIDWATRASATLYRGRLTRRSLSPSLSRSPRAASKGGGPPSRRTTSATSPFRLTDTAVVTLRDLEDNDAMGNCFPAEGAATDAPSLPTVAGTVRAAETLRRQELAVSALWSLTHNHQRGKRHVKEALMQVPAVAIDRLFPFFVAEAEEDSQAEVRPTREEENSVYVEAVEVLDGHSHRERQPQRAVGFAPALHAPSSPSPTAVV